MHKWWYFDDNESLKEVLKNENKDDEERIIWINI